MLGRGGYGTVYKSSWHGQPAAFKFTKMEVGIPGLLLTDDKRTAIVGIPESRTSNILVR